MMLKNDIDIAKQEQVLLKENLIDQPGNIKKLINIFNIVCIFNTCFQSYTAIPPQAVKP